MDTRIVGHNYLARCNNTSTPLTIPRGSASSGLPLPSIPKHIFNSLRSFQHISDRYLPRYKITSRLLAIVWRWISKSLPLPANTTPPHPLENVLRACHVNSAYRRKLPITPYHYIEISGWSLGRPMKRPAVAHIYHLPPATRLRSLAHVMSTYIPVNPFLRCLRYPFLFPLTFNTALVSRRHHVLRVIFGGYTLYYYVVRFIFSLHLPLFVLVL